MATGITRDVATVAQMRRNWQILATEFGAAEIDVSSRNMAEFSRNWRAFHAASPGTPITINALTLEENRRNWRIVYDDLT